MQEKQIQLSGLNINYKIIGTGKNPIVLLHGWGISSDKYVSTAEEILKQDGDYVFYIPDLPGFGKSEEPKENWKLDDYLEFVKEFFTSVAQRDGGFEPIKNILEKAVKSDEESFKVESKKVILIGHSFGGRIAIKYAAKYPEDLGKLVLTGAAGIKHPLTPKQKLFFYSSKAGKKIFGLPVLKSGEKFAKKFLYKIVREKDYANASPRMKEVMKNVLDEDLTPVLDKINVPTMLIWGREDHSTPLTDGELMNEKIKNSKLFVIDNANHSAPYNNAEKFAEIFMENLK